MDMNMNITSIIIIGIISGLLSTMNLWVIKYNDTRIHLNDFYMAFIMTGWMLLFHLLYGFSNSHMKIPKQAIILSLFIIVFTFYCIRTQKFINDIQFLNGMIPHHSMAILMSEKIMNKTKNDKIRRLAKNIILSQKKEIVQMNKILNDYK
jgi:hypothetical protein